MFFVFFVFVGVEESSLTIAQGREITDTNQALPGPAEYFVYIVLLIPILLQGGHQHHRGISTGRELRWRKGFQT